MSRKLLVPALLFLFLPASLLAMACSDGDPDTVPGVDSTQAADGSNGSSDLAARAQVEQTIRETVEAYADQDLARFLENWTADGLQTEFGGTRQEIEDVGAEFFGGPPIVLRNFLETNVDGDEATSEFELVFGISLSPQRYELVKDDGTWKINSTEEIQAEIPPGTTTVEVAMDDFSFDYDASQAASGNIAFRAENVGEQPHELILLKVPAEFTVEQLLEAADQEIPEGVEAVGFAGPVESGDEVTLVFTETLSNGKYMMVCFLPDEEDPEGTPHVIKGMASEFNVTG